MYDPAIDFENKRFFCFFGVDLCGREPHHNEVEAKKTQEEKKIKIKKKKKKKKSKKSKKEK